MGAYTLAVKNKLVQRKKENHYEKSNGVLPRSADGRPGDDLRVCSGKDVNPGSVTFDQDSFINGKASVELEYDAVAEPTYTITIPMGVQLVKGGTTSTFKAEGISNLNGGKIVLSITSTRKSGMPDDCPGFRAVSRPQLCAV